MAAVQVRRIERLGDGPIIEPNMDARMGDNINGPSLIRVPEWVDNPLGRYYLYFGHHDGHYIRLAYADALTGPWRTYEEGVLPLASSCFKGHIASPDVHVDHERRCIRMYFHGADVPTGPPGPQWTRCALSTDGLQFEARAEELGRSYMRVIPYQDEFLAMAMPGIFYRSRDGISNFEIGPTLFDADMRHGALLQVDERLLVFFTTVGHRPERILCSAIGLREDWSEWRESAPVDVLLPARDYEGANAPLKPSVRGLATEPVNELRDPAIFVEGDATYLLYSVAGETGIAIAQIELS